MKSMIQAQNESPIGHFLRENRFSGDWCITRFTPVRGVTAGMQCIPVPPCCRISRFMKPLENVCPLKKCFFSIFLFIVGLPTQAYFGPLRTMKVSKFSETKMIFTSPSRNDSRLEPLWILEFFWGRPTKPPSLLLHTIKVSKILDTNIIFTSPKNLGAASAFPQHCDLSEMIPVEETLSFQFFFFGWPTQGLAYTP